MRMYSLDSSKFIQIQIYGQVAPFAIGNVQQDGKVNLTFHTK